jgi:Spy/CpxP family protein refolding chaperone
MQKKTVVFGMFLFVIVLLPAILAAQMRHRGSMKPSCLSYDCMPVENLDLDGEQRVAIEKIDRAYNDEKTGLQGDLMRKRIELQAVFRNPQAEEEKIRTIAREVSQLQDRCLETMIDHQLKVRALLRPEQLRRWCTLEPCFAKGLGREP